MKRFEITFAAFGAADEGYLLCTAGKIISELQAMGTGCMLVPAPAPWQLAVRGVGEPDYIRRQVLDVFDRKRGNVLITEAG